MPERGGWSGYLSYGNATVVQTGPINGGLPLTDQFVEIDPGAHFTPGHDVRNAVSFAVTYAPRCGRLWATLFGRYESGTPLEVEEEQLEELRSRPGAELVDFERGGVRPWAVFDPALGWDVLREERVSVSAELEVQNVTGRRFVYNFGNPFFRNPLRPPAAVGRARQVRFPLAPEVRVPPPPLDPQPERREAECHLQEVERDVRLMPAPEGLKPRVPRITINQIEVCRDRGHAGSRPEILRERDEPHRADGDEGGE